MPMISGTLGVLSNFWQGAGELNLAIRRLVIYP